jgi:hypothetical protein
MFINPRFLTVLIPFLQDMNLLIHLNKTTIYKLIVHFILYRIVNQSYAIDMRPREILGGFKLLILSILWIWVYWLIRYFLIELIVDIWFDNCVLMVCFCYKSFLLIRLFSQIPIDVLLNFLMVLLRCLIKSKVFTVIGLWFLLRQGLWLNIIRDIECF